MKQLQEQINSLSHEEQELHKDLIQECLERDQQLKNSRIVERLNFLCCIK